MSGGPDIHATIQPDEVAAFRDALATFRRDLAQRTEDLYRLFRSVEDGRWNDPNYHECLSRLMRLVRQVEHIDDQLIDRQMLPALERIITAARNAKL